MVRVPSQTYLFILRLVLDEVEAITYSVHSGCSENLQWAAQWCRLQSAEEDYHPDAHTRSSGVREGTSEYSLSDCLLASIRIRIRIRTFYPRPLSLLLQVIAISQYLTPLCSLLLFNH